MVLACDYCGKEFATTKVQKAHKCAAMGLAAKIAAEKAARAADADVEALLDDVSAAPAPASAPAPPPAPLRPRPPPHPRPVFAGTPRDPALPPEGSPLDAQQLMVLLTQMAQVADAKKPEPVEHAARPVGEMRLDEARLYFEALISGTARYVQAPRRSEDALEEIVLYALAEAAQRELRASPAQMERFARHVGVDKLIGIAESRYSVTDPIQEVMTYIDKTPVCPETIQAAEDGIMPTTRAYLSRGDYRLNLTAPGTTLPEYLEQQQINLALANSRQRQQRRFAQRLLYTCAVLAHFAAPELDVLKPEHYTLWAEIEMAQVMAKKFRGRDVGALDANLDVPRRAEAFREVIQMLVPDLDLYDEPKRR
jgi:hypothetical protein